MTQTDAVRGVVEHFKNRHKRERMIGYLSYTIECEMADIEALAAEIEKVVMEGMEAEKREAFEAGGKSKVSRWYDSGVPAAYGPVYPTYADYLASRKPKEGK